MTSGFIKKSDVVWKDQSRKLRVAENKLMDSPRIMYPGSIYFAWKTAYFWNQAFVNFYGFKEFNGIILWKLLLCSFCVEELFCYMSLCIKSLLVFLKLLSAKRRKKAFWNAECSLNCCIKDYVIRFYKNIGWGTA